MKELIGKSVRVEWRRPEDDWPTFTVLAYDPPMLHLQGRDDGRWKHHGDTFWVNTAEIVSIVPEQGEGIVADAKECPRCEGSGEIYDACWTCGDPECCGSGRGECPDCQGTGTIPTPTEAADRER